ncbi:Aldo/keto reductase [Fistulina hepatica ATCC 64428]|uniref:Aldo/keto reductase n=1 Tax=Fistulina hepatica ATCC 64428 TaxID=1128425 RepID=A0A0D7ANK8_9AGAR|nr:Aldo/keto reductase [Fistulina hepatica ATCC 64428]
MPVAPVKVEYRRLGNSGLRVSVPILGAGHLAGNKAFASFGLNEDAGIELLKAAWDRGINTIDTANTYWSGESEVTVGKFVKKYNIPRNKLVILTKCFFAVTEDFIHDQLNPALLNSRDYVNQAGLSRAAIFNAVEASLARLDTPYIDLYQIHRFDPETPVEETMKALHDLVQSGKVRYIGASSMRAWQFAHMNEVARRNGWTTFVSMQNEYSLLYREEATDSFSKEREMLPYCKFHGIGVIPWSPLGGGDLARPRNSPETVRQKLLKNTPLEIKANEADAEIVDRVDALAKKRGWSMPQVALFWVKTKATSPIIGVNSIERLEGSLTEGLELTAEEIATLEEPYKDLPVRGLTV